MAFGSVAVALYRGATSKAILALLQQRALDALIERDPDVCGAAVPLFERSRVIGAGDAPADASRPAHRG